jgi:hypothetical protein
VPAPDSTTAEGTSPAAAGSPAGGPRPTVPYAYAVIRIVPRVERGECFNAGVVAFCRPKRFLAARVHLDPARLAALAPGTDPGPIARLLERIPLVCAGGAAAGPIGRLPQTERFHWLTAPTSTVVQPGPVHPGLTADPAAALERLFAELVLPISPGERSKSG